MHANLAELSARLAVQMDVDGATDFNDQRQLPDEEAIAQNLHGARQSEAATQRDVKQARHSKAQSDSPSVKSLTPETDAKVKLTTDEGSPRSQASILTDLGKAHYLFHDEGGDAYARIRVNRHYEILVVTGTAYREFLSREYYRLTGKGAGRNAIADAVNTLTAMAKHDGLQESVYLRTAAIDGGIVIDTGCEDWNCIEIKSTGWRVTPDRVANFRRSGKAIALPKPTKADFNRIWRYVNVEEADRPLIAGWLLTALWPTGPYPILLLIGEQGSGKSAASRTLKRLTDPSAVLLRSPPREERDLLVSALSSWVLALDNMSGTKPELSDALCRIATGGGLAGRTLYTNTEETLVEIKRPLILNGIDDLASRPDLAERCLHIELPLLRTRCTEAELERGFSEDSGAIFAALLDALTLALRDQHVPRERLPRMADAAQVAAAGVPALGFSSEDFLNAYRANQAGAIESGLETSGLASALRKLITRQSGWSGSAAQLLMQIEHETTDRERSAPGWPRSAKGLITILRRLAPALRHVGIGYTRSRDANSRSLNFACFNPEHVSQASHMPLNVVADDAMTLVTPARPGLLPGADTEVI